MCTNMKPTYALLVVVMWLPLSASVGTAAAARTPAGAAAAPPPRFPVFVPCSKAAGDGTDQGLCRAASRTLGKARPKEMPIDMRLPCDPAQGSLACHKNVDVAAPALPPPGRGVRAACNVTLMPWSPFPCRFDASSATGVPGQRTDFCYSSPSAPAAPPGPAASLETDGYNNVYRGRSPVDGGAPCAGLADAGIDVRLLLRVDFRLASGRQYDRTYHFQIGDAVAAFGTCSEPARAKGHDKRWSAVADVTHLRAYLKPGQPTRFALSNVLSNVYNVPLWASAQLEVYYTAGDAGAALAAAAAAEAQSGKEAATVAAQEAPPPRSRLLQKQAGKACSPPPPLRLAGAAPPDAVVPLVPPGRAPGDDNAVFVLPGSGDSPKHWPRATFPLPRAPFDAGDVYRAQLVATPKANGCEEFWAMNPSGARTDSTCGGLSTGEPYRELRVRVDGQHAGFAPVRYTMYSGGCDPRLWSAVTGHPMFVLPSYTFDLSPWLGALNAPPPPAAEAAGDKRAKRGSKHDAAGHGAAGGGGGRSVSVELAGASGADWHVAAELRLWRAPGRRVTTAAAAAAGAQQQQQQQTPRVTLSPPAAADDSSSGWGAPPASECAGANLTDAGACALALRPRRLVAEAALKIDGEPFTAAVEYRLAGYESEVAWNNTGGFASWASRIRGFEASWFFGRPGVPGAQRTGAAQLQQQQQKRAPLQPNASSPSPLPDVISSGMRRDEWLHTGGIAVGHPFEFSHNFTATSVQARVPPSAPQAGSGSCGDDAAPVALASQRHYQRLLMLELYGSAAPPLPTPTYATHTASLNATFTTSSSSGGGGGIGGSESNSCVAWAATAAWGAPAPMSSELRVVDGGSCSSGVGVEGLVSPKA